MDFGSVPLAKAKGAILAHRLTLTSGILKKGSVLSEPDIARLRENGQDSVIVARLGRDDLGENEAARLIADTLVPDPNAAGVRLATPFTGRVNIHATRTGLLKLQIDKIHQINATDAVITTATLPNLARVDNGTLVATVKIISYGVKKSAVLQATEGVSGALTTLPVTRQTASLVLTRTKGMTQKVFDKGRLAVAQRLKSLGITLTDTHSVDHTEAALATALQQTTGGIVLILTASATSDARDVGPMGLVRAGGTLTRFGLPVDPGNLLFLGQMAEQTVIGLPGCARSMALNGADWVLERIACGLQVSNDDMAAMAVGGLLKETPNRPLPREGNR